SFPAVWGTIRGPIQGVPPDQMNATSGARKAASARTAPTPSAKIPARATCPRQSQRPLMSPMGSLRELATLVRATLEGWQTLPLSCAKSGDYDREVAPRESLLRAQFR